MKLQNIWQIAHVYYPSPIYGMNIDEDDSQHLNLSLSVIHQPVHHQSHSSLNQAHGRSLLRLAGVLTMMPLLESSIDYSKEKIMIHLN